MWLLLSLAAAVCTTVADVLTKKAGRGLPEDVLALARWLYALPVLACALPGLEMPRPSGSFWKLVLVMGPLEIGAVLLYVRAISGSPLSLSVPFLSFTPALILVTGALFLGERIPAIGSAGVVLVAAGAYCMTIGGIRRGGLAEPIRAIFRDAGPRQVLAVAAIYAVTSALGKRVVLEVGPRFFAFFYTALLAVLFFPVLVLAGRSARPVLVHWRKLLPIGLILGLVTIAQFTAYTMAPVAYVIAVKRTSMVTGVVAGRLIFGEEKFAERMLGSGLMLAGVVLIAFAA